MSRLQKWKLGICLGLLVVLMLVVGFVVLGNKLRGGMGSPSEARRLRPIVEAMPAPMTSRIDYNADTVSAVFPNGEWIVGMAKDSGAFYSKILGGGTIVIKNSRGRVRCFFEHVSGGAYDLYYPTKEDSLDAFDVHLQKNYAEQAWADLEPHK